MVEANKLQMMAERLENIARHMTYQTEPETIWKQGLLEIASSLRALAASGQAEAPITADHVLAEVLKVVDAMPSDEAPVAAEPGEREILSTYEKLHEGKLGAHWLWVVIEQIAAGIPEDQAMADFGYFEKKPQEGE